MPNRRRQRVRMPLRPPGRSPGPDRTNLLAGVSLAAIAVTAGLWLGVTGGSALTGPPTDAHGCRADRPLAVFAVDTAAAYSTDQKAAVQTLIQREIARLAPESRLRVHALDARSEVVAEPVVAVCAPPAATGGFTGASARFVAGAKAKLEDALLGDLAIPYAPEPGGGDGLIRSLATLQESLVREGGTADALTITLYSDFAAAPGLPEDADARLDGMRVHLVHAAASTRKDETENRRVAAWTAALQEAGAHLPRAVLRIDGPRHIERDANGCPITPEREIIAIVDATGPYAPVQWATLRRALVTAADGLPPNGVLEIHRLDETESDPAPRPRRLCAPEDEPLARERFLAHAEGEIDGALAVPAAADTSPILERIAARFRDRRPTVARRDVLVFSDFLFDSAGIPFMENGAISFEEAAGREAVARNLVDLGGGRARILYARRDSAGAGAMQGPEHHQFVLDWLASMTLAVDADDLIELADN